MFSRVDFPQPLGPTMLVRLPSGTSRQMSSQTRFFSWPLAPNDLLTCATVTNELPGAGPGSGAAATVWPAGPGAPAVPAPAAEAACCDRLTWPCINCAPFRPGRRDRDPCA